MFDFKAFGEQLVVTVREHVARALDPVKAEVTALRKIVDELPAPQAIDVDMVLVQALERAEARIYDRVKAAVAEIPRPKDGEDGEDGKSVDTVALAELCAKSVAQIVEALPKPPTADDVVAAAAPLIERAIGAIPVPTVENGKDADVDAITADVLHRVTKALESIPVPRDGHDADPAAISEAVRVELQRAIGDLPRPQDGKSIDTAELAQEIVKAAAVVVDAMPAPQIQAEAIAEIVDARFAEAAKALQPADDISGLVALADALIAKFSAVEHAEA